MSARPVALLWVIPLLVACEDPAVDGALEPGELSDSVPEETLLYAIGDSIFEWHAEDEASAPEVVGEVLDRPMTNAAVSGGMLDANKTGASSIPDQYQPGDWSWLVMDGGGNDLNDTCGCGDCGAVMDNLISDDGIDGILPELVQAVSDAGVKVIYMGYAGIPEEAEYGFDRCGDELDVLRSRATAMAAAHEGVWFVDMSETISGADEDFFDDDMIHPSLAGSRLMGEVIAQTIAAVESGALAAD